MPRSFHKNTCTGKESRQEKCKLSSLVCCRPFKRSNRHLTRQTSSQNFTAEKVCLSVEEECPPSEIDYDRGYTAMSGPVRAEPYHWPHDGRLESATTALVIIDMQRDFCEDGGYMAHQGYDITPAKNVIPVIKSVLEKFREDGYPIYFTREGHRPDLSTLSAREHYRSRNNREHLGIGDKGPLGRLLIRGESGHNIVDDLRPLENEPIIDKPGRGAFAHTEFELMLSIKGIKNLVICGVTTDVCVTSTLREANDRRFDCVLVSNACAAGDAALHDAAVQTIKEEGGIFGTVTTAEELLRALKETTTANQRQLSNYQPSPVSNTQLSMMMNGSGDNVDNGARSTVEKDAMEAAQLTIVTFPTPPKTPQDELVNQFATQSTEHPKAFGQAPPTPPSDAVNFSNATPSDASLHNGLPSTRVVRRTWSSLFKSPEKGP